MGNPYYYSRVTVADTSVDSTVIHVFVNQPALVLNTFTVNDLNNAKFPS